MLIERGADLVYLAEELYLRLFVLTLLLTAIGCAMSVWFATVDPHAALLPTTMIAALAFGLAFAALIRPRQSYLWLRYSRARQLTPALLAILAVLCNGPDSPSWWVALPLLWTIAAVSSTGLALAAAITTSLAYLAGTLIGGEPLIHAGNAGILAAAVALPTNILIGRLVAEIFTRFVLRLHRIEREVRRSASPVHVPPAAGGHDRRDAASKTGPREKRTSLPRFGGLTARELEALLLVRDGLLHKEIALAMGVSTRQVERLLASARSRTKAATNSELVAVLVAEGIAP